jgi:hypothetical protein
MTDSRRTGFLRRATFNGAWLLACAEVVVASPAGAVVAPYVSVNVERSIPVGGVVTGNVQCQPACTASKLNFSASDGTPVSGRLFEGAIGAAGNFVFIPEPPLQAGTYSASASGPLNTATASFTVVDTAFELPKFTSNVTAETVPEGALIQCQEQAPGVPPAWFTEKTRVRPRVTASFTGPYMNQYRYALALPSETPSPFVGLPVQRSFDVEGDELCFEAFGFSYQSDAVTPLGQDCVSLVGLGVGVKDEIAGDLRQTLLGCVVPPAGYETNWCAAFGPAFTSKSCEGFGLDACFAARRGCPSGDHPSDQQEQAERASRANTGAGGGSGTGGSVSSGGAGVLSGGANGQAAASPTNEQDNNKQNANPSRDVQGCSFGRGQSGGLTSWLLMFSPLLLLSRRRRF